MTIANKLKLIASNTPQVYESGYNSGYDSGREKGYEQGEASGYASGYAAGADAGYGNGYTDGSEGKPYKDVYAGWITQASAGDDELLYNEPAFDDYDCECIELIGASGYYPYYTEDGKLQVTVNLEWNNLPVVRIKRIRARAEFDAVGGGDAIASSDAYIYTKDMGGTTDLYDIPLTFVAPGYDSSYAITIHFFFEVYEEQQTDGIYIGTVKFDSWHNGVTENTLKHVPHGLRVKPRYVAIVADDVTAIEGATFPDGIIAAIVQADGTYNADTNTHYVATYLRRKDAEISNGAIVVGSYKLIHGWDETHVYLNAASTTYAWCPDTITTYTIICLA